MKKFISAILCLCLMLSLNALPVSARTFDEANVIDVVESYLSTSASVKYELTDGDLIMDTVSNAGATALISMERELGAEVASPNLLETEVTIDPQIGTYLKDKAEYIKYTRIQEDLNIDNFSVTYGTPEVKIQGNYAVVKVFETIGMRYKGLDEDSAISTNYTVTLIRTTNGWKIANIESDDLFDEVHKDSFNYEQAVQDYKDQMLEPDFCKVEVESPSMAELSAAVAATGGKVYPYNHTYAAYYSNQYTTSTGVNTKSYYNSNFSNYAGQGGDCMNFASQCVFAGFGGSDESPINTTAFPMDRQGSNYKGLWYKDSQTWNGTLSFQDYGADSGNRYLSENNMAIDMYLTGPNSAAIYDYTNRLPGSIIFVLDGDGDLGHAMVVGKVTGSASSQIFVTAHTNDVKLQPLSQCNSGHIFRIATPNAYYSYSNTPALKVSTAWKNNVPSGTTVTFSGTAERLTGGTCYSMKIKVVSPSGVQTTSAVSSNTNSKSFTQTLTEKGLYKITTIAKEYSYSSEVTNTIALRTY